jgi:competence protein ComEC
MSIEKIKKYFVRFPAVGCVSLLICGILASEYLPIAGVGFISISILAIYLSLVHKQSLKSSFQFSVLIIFFLIGALFHLVNNLYFHQNVVQKTQTVNHIVIDGWISSDVVEINNTARFIFQSENIYDRNINFPFEKRLNVYVNRMSRKSVTPSLSIGKRLRLTGTLEQLSYQRNPGGYDWGRYLELNDIHGTFIVRDTIIQLLDSRDQKAKFPALVQHLRKILDKRLCSMYDSIQASFLRGLLLAEKSEIPRDINRSFILTGTIHILVVSGTHIGIIALFLYGLFSFLRFPRITRTISVIIGLVFYSFLTGSEPPVVRATIMASVVLIGMLIERKTYLINSLAIAALIILIWNTKFLFNAGFQLSFISVWGLFYFSPKLRGIKKFFPMKFHSFKLFQIVAEIIIASSAAIIAIIPFVVHYFNFFSIIALPANILAIPLGSVTIVLGILSLLVSFISNTIAFTFVAVNNFIIFLLIWIIKESASIPFAFIEVYRSNLILYLIYFSAVIVIFNLSNKRILFSGLVVLLLLINVFIWWEFSDSSNKKLRMTVLDVGQGDAIYLEFPGGKNVLIDAGFGDANSDAGKKVVLPFLKHNGTKSLNSMVLSHDDEDHIGGALSVINTIQVKQLILPYGQTSELLKTITQTAIKRGTEIVRLKAGEIFDVGTNVPIYVMNPFDSLGNENASSYVFKIIFGSRSILLTGDIGLEIEEALIRRYGVFLQSDILKVSHHGSETSTSNLFLSTVKPIYAIISAGKSNIYNHPSNKILDLLTQSGVIIHRTDTEGAIVFQTDGQSIEEVKWH